MGQWVGQWFREVGQCRKFPDGCLVMASAIREESAFAPVGFNPSKGSKSDGYLP